MKRSTHLLATLLLLTLASVASAAETERGVNLAPVAEVTTSYASPWAALNGINDGHAPKKSVDSSKKTYGNWPKKDTQWVQYDWTAPVTTKTVAIFWLDDNRGIGVPNACRVLYWDGKKFVPVSNPKGLGVAKDKFNTTTFDEVRTTKLRLEIDSD
jgi:hypothetical protein